MLGFALKYWQYIVLVMFLFGLYIYHQGRSATIEELRTENTALVKDVATEKGNVVRLTDEIGFQNDTILRMDKKQARAQKEVTELALKENAARLEVTKLRKTFAEHDLDRIANSKPKTLTKIINRASSKAMKELERLTDPAVLEAEVAGK